MILQHIRQIVREIQETEQVVEKNNLRLRTRVEVFVLSKSMGVLAHISKPNALPKLPGGAMDVNESLIDAAKRELMEEAGYIAKNFRILIGQPVEHIYTDPTDAESWFLRDGWNGEINYAVVCDSPEFKPDSSFGSEGDHEKFEFYDIEELYKLNKNATIKNKRRRNQQKFRQMGLERLMK